MEKICVHCGNNFFITEIDKEFLNYFAVPEFNECYLCRRKHKLAFVNYTTFYLRPNDVFGKDEKIISTIDENAPFPVYDNEYYYSDLHNPLDFYIEYNDNKTFFENLYELFKICPQPALNQNPTNINSPYLNGGAHMKDAYYCFGGFGTEHIAYSMWSLNSRDSHDTLIAIESEKVYDSVFPEKSFNSNFLYFSRNIMDSQFMYDCRNCSNCFGCVNLRHKKYNIFNIQYSEGEYFEKIKEYDLANTDILEKVKINFWDFVKKFPIRASHNEHSSNSSGVFILNSNNVNDSVWVINGEHLLNTEFSMSVKDSFDVLISSNSNNLCNVVSCDDECFNIKHSSFCRNTSNAEYSIFLKNCKYCFACVGLRDKSYCVFNIQYTKEEYEEKVKYFKNILVSEGLYGSFFPLIFSFYSYNASLAFLIDEDKNKNILLKNGSRFTEPHSNISSDTKLIEVKGLPKNLNEIDEEIINFGIIGLKTKRPYKIRKEDLDFYKTHNVYIPLYHPIDRFKSRLDILNNFQIKKVVCQKCSNIVNSNFSDKEYIIYCDDCFTKEVI
jgi:hypothetical protein